MFVPRGSYITSAEIGACCAVGVTMSTWSLKQRSFPEDGCGWVVTANKRLRPYDCGTVRVAGGIYRSRAHAEGLCHSSYTVCALVVWDRELAEKFFEAYFSRLDRKSIEDLAYYFGTEASRKLVRRDDERRRNASAPEVFS